MEVCGDPAKIALGLLKLTVPLSGSGEYYRRCDHHYELYVERLQPVMDEINRRYPPTPPPDFDPYFAGESWEKDAW